MKKSVMSKSMAVILSTILLVSAASGCGTSPKADPVDTAIASATSSQATPTQEVKSEEPVPIRWVRAGNEQDPTKDRILLELQKRTNIKLEIVSIPWDQFPNKLNIMMSSGENIDLANCDPGKTLNEWARNGLVRAYDDFLKDGKYPYVASVVNSEVYKGLRIDGKAYMKPLGLVPMQWGFLIRQDWLDNVGLGIPTNIDEFYEVVKAFKEKDPDKNGKDDTYGIYTRAGGMENPSGTMMLAYIARAFTIQGAWINTPDGSITRYELSDAAKESTRFIRKLVSEKLINRDWTSLKRDPAQGPESDDFAAGKYGIAPTTNPDIFMEKLKKVNPDAKLSYLPPLNGVNGVPANSGHSGGFWWGNVLPTTGKNPEKVLELLDYSLTMEGRELTEYGIKDIHFTDVKEENNRRIYTVNKAECDKDWDTKKNGYLYPLTWGGFNYYEYAYIPIKEKNFNYDEAFKNIQAWLPEDKASGQFPDWTVLNSKYAIASPLMNVMDDKLIGDYNKLESIYGEGWLKAVLGTGDFDKTWNDMIQRWLKEGGQEIIDYGVEYYKNNK